MIKYKNYGIDVRHKLNGGGFQAAYKAPRANGAREGDDKNFQWICVGQIFKTEEEVKAFIDQRMLLK